MPKTGKKELLKIYRNAKITATDNGINCIPYQWQKAIEKGWKIECSDFKKDIDDKYNYHEWYRPLGNGSLECIGLVQHVKLEKFRFDKPTEETLRKEVKLLSKYLNGTGYPKEIIQKQAILVHALLVELDLAF